MEAPEGYRKYKDVDLATYRVMNPSLKRQLNPKYLMAFEIVNELLDKTLAINILEPYTMETEHFKIKPKPL
jgi:uncharacterized protein YwgA